MFMNDGFRREITLYRLAEAILEILGTKEFVRRENGLQLRRNTFTVNLLVASCPKYGIVNRTPIHCFSPRRFHAREAS